MNSLKPTQTQDREVFMDALRGFAILGIFIANLTNFSWYNESEQVAGRFILPNYDAQMSFLHHWFIEGKFYTIFSLLFGWGIALQFKRATDRGLNPLPTIKRRLVFMLILGAIHLLLWPGDIVFFYAMLGSLLIPMQKFSDRALLYVGFLLILSPIALYTAKSYWLWLNAPVVILEQVGGKLHTYLTGQGSTLKDVVQYLGETSWWGVLTANVSGFFYRYSYLFFVSRVPKVLGMFLIGYFVGRSGFYQKLHQQKKWLWWIVIFGLVIGLPANYMLAHYMSNFMDDYFKLNRNGFYQTLAYALGVVPLAMAYVGIFMMIFQSDFGKRLLSIFVPVGRTAFSNYVFQTFVGSYIFLGAGLGYIGKVGPVYLTLLGLLVFIVQLLLSAIWLRFFNYGPIEWLWRSATYKQWQTMRKK